MTLWLRRAFAVPASRVALQGAWAPVLCLGAACLSVPLQAQAQAQQAQSQAQSGGRSLTIVPTFDAVVTYSDSSLRDSSGQRGGDFITQIRPGVQLSSRSGRIRGNLSYALNAVHHSKPTSEPGIQHFLSGVLNAEAIEDWLFVDAAANVSQRSLSAFGQQSVGNDAQSNNNRDQVATASISPYVRGALGSFANYEGRLSTTTTRARRTINGDSTTDSALLALNSVRGGLLGWNLVASRQRADFRAGRTTQNDRISLGITATPIPEVSFGLRGGRETTDVGALVRNSYDNYGWEARWTPNPRTLLSAESERRYFGQSHRVVVEHRLPRSSLRFTSTSNVSNGADPTGVGAPITLYQLFFSQFASIQPDPALREQLVLAFLRGQGLDPTSRVGGGFINTGVSLQNRQDLSWSYSGLRTSLVLQAFSTRSERIDTASLAPDDGLVRQSGYTATLAHRLTPTASASLTGLQQKTESNAGRAGNDLKSVSLSYSDRISRRATTTVTARHSVFSSATDPYRESAVSASLSLRF